MATIWRGVRSKRIARASGSSPSDPTRRPVSMTPPRLSKYEAIACTIDRDPPRAHGHPMACPATASTRPIAAVSGVSSGRIEWAAQPAKRARACAPAKRSHSPRAERSADSPKRVRSRGCRGARSGARRSGMRSSARLANGSISERYAAASSPSVSPVSATERSSTAALPSSSGCASGASGCTHASPCSASGSVRRKGETTPIGWMAEQTSCKNPGNVSSAVRAPPPIVSFASITRTPRPAWARRIAAASPLGPEPTTIAS